METKEYIQYENYLKQKESLNKLERKGFKFIHKKNMFKIIAGLGCLVIAVIPNGLSLIFYPLGFILLNINRIDLFKYKEIGIKKVKRFLI